MIPETAASTESEGQIEIVDVWSRTSRRHRIRTILMLILLAILFGGLCCFTFWLRTGQYLPWNYHNYNEILRNSFTPSGIHQVTLSDFLSSPIHVQNVPIHAVIMGLQFAALSSIPILIAILYRLPTSVLFCAMVFFLAAMPWLGITLMIGCLLASMNFFRFRFRYASALIGLVPVAIYFVMASWEPSGMTSKMVQQKALLYAPWVLALLASCVICAVALAIARLIDYRPGGIPPVLAMLFAMPVFLFHSQVGRDELEFRLLEQAIGPGTASVFSPVDISALAMKMTEQTVSQRGGSSREILYKEFLEDYKDRVVLRVERERSRAIASCDKFFENFPRSRYVPTVLCLKGRVQDGRVDLDKLERLHRAEFRTDRPNRASRRTWLTLLERFPDSDLSLIALYNLAILSARDGDLQEAVDLLDKLTQRLNTNLTTRPAGSASSGVSAVFRKAPPSSSLRINTRVLTIQARRLHEMLHACQADKPRPISELFGPRADGSDVLVKPVQLLMRLDDSAPQFEANLQAIQQAFEESEASGYVEVRLAMQEADLAARIQRSRDAVEKLQGRQAEAEARFYLGEALQEDAQLGEAKVVFEELAALRPNSCWAQEAKQRLTSLSILQEAAQ